MNKSLPFAPASINIANTVQIESELENIIEEPTAFLQPNPTNGVIQDLIDPIQANSLQGTFFQISSDDEQFEKLELPIINSNQVNNFEPLISIDIILKNGYIEENLQSDNQSVTDQCDQLILTIIDSNNQQNGLLFDLHDTPEHFLQKDYYKLKNQPQFESNQPISPSLMVLSDIEEDIICNDFKLSPVYPKSNPKSDLLINTQNSDLLIQRQIPELIYPQQTKKESTANQDLNQTESNKIIDTNQQQESHSTIKTNSKPTQVESSLKIDSKQNKDESHIKSDSNQNNSAIKNNSNQTEVKSNQSKAESSKSIKKILKCTPNEIKKNRLFPSTTNTVPLLKDSTDKRKVIITNDQMIQYPGFQQEFAEFRVTIRKLKTCDIEIDERTCVIFRPAQQNHEEALSFENSPYHVNSKNLLDCLSKFDVVYLVISLENFMPNTKSRKKASNYAFGNNLKKSSYMYGNEINLKVREFPTDKAAFDFIKSIVKSSKTFLRDCETLHEFVLSLFPTISKTLAQMILQKGNPISDVEMNLDQFPQKNVVPFKILLNAKSEEFIQNDEDDKFKLNTENDEPNLNISSIPSNIKINAPIPI